MPKLINWEMIKNPYNWVVVGLMVTIAAFAWGMIDPLKTNATQGDAP